MMNRLDTFDAIISGLERAGWPSRPGWKGGRAFPTSICHGGESRDKLHILRRDDGGFSAVCWTRGCSGPEFYARIRTAAGIPDAPGRGFRRSPAHAPTRPVGPETPKTAGNRGLGSDTAALARSLWATSQQIPASPGHPARRWLATRNLWRPELPLPTAVRWLPSEAHKPGPHTGAGSILAAIAPPHVWAEAWPEMPIPQAVQLIAVNANGQPAFDRPARKGGLQKRTLGTAGGGLVLLGNPVLADAWGPVRVAEGLADALALTSRFEGPAVALLGTAGFDSRDVAQWLANAEGCMIHSDADGPGQDAARRLRRAVQDAGGAARAVLPGVEGAKDAGAVGLPFAELADGWSDYAATLAEMHPWPRWEVARLASIQTGED